RASRDPPGGERPRERTCLRGAGGGDLGAAGGSHGGGPGGCLVSVSFAPVTVRETDLALSREWLVGNGLGGYASGSVPGACTRRQHGLLVAALPAPFGRIVMLTRVVEEVRFADGTGIRLDAEEPSEGGAKLHGAQG